MLFKKLSQEQLESISRVRATSNHLFIVILVWADRDPREKRSATDDTSLDQRRQACPIVKVIYIDVPHPGVIIGNFIVFCNLL